MLFESYNPLEISPEGGRGMLEQGNIYQIIKFDGTVDEDALKQGYKNPEEELGDDFVKQMYEEMTLTRMADDKFIKMQRTGRMGTYASSKGQEGCQIPVAHTLKKTDWVVPAFRETGIMHMHGVPLEKIFQYWGGFEIGSQMPSDVNVLPISIPIATQMLHAVGIAWAAKMRGEKTVAVAYFSDGATSEGDFHEGMNFAGVFKTATIFICQNNHYAISTPWVKQTATPTLAQKGIAYNVPSMQVDGNDPLAMYAVTREAVERGRNGGGASFIEAVTYRLGDHTTADDGNKYRSKEEVAEWEGKEPLVRMKAYLEKRRLWSEEWQKEVEEKVSAKIQAAVEAYEATPIPTSDAMFKHVHEEMSVHLHEQYDYIKQFYPSN
jgi:pyruvate dehydrogenase E1 component alpha subunit